MSWTNLNLDAYDITDEDIPGETLYHTDLLTFIESYGGNYQDVPVKYHDDCRKVLERDRDWTELVTVFESGVHQAVYLQHQLDLRVRTTCIIDGKVREVNDIDRTPDDEQADPTVGIGRVSSENIEYRMTMTELQEKESNGDIQFVEQIY